MSTAVVAVHFQNDVLHPDGKIRAGFARRDPARSALLKTARRLLDGARTRGIPVVSVAIEFRRLLERWRTGPVIPQPAPHRRVVCR